MIRTNTTFALIVSLCVLGFAVPSGAQDPNYTLSINPPLSQTVTGLPASVSQNLDFPNGIDIAGWSWGLCHSGGQSVVDILNVMDGSTTMTVNGGAPPAFNAPALLPGEGWTIGVVINFFGDNPLVPGSGYELHIAQYSALGEGLADLNYCNTLGTPLVETTLVDSAGGSISPTTEPAEIDVQGFVPFVYQAPSGTFGYDGMTGDGQIVADVTIGEDQTGPMAPQDTQGFSLGLAHDGALLTVTDLAEAAALSDLNGGTGPDFFGPNLDPMPGPGFTVGVVYNFLGGVFIQFGAVATPTPVVTVTYAINGPTMTMDPTLTTLVWSDDLGTPPVENTVVVDGGSAGVLLVNGEITLQPGVDPVFLRGDCNDDTTVNIADGIWILNELFQGGPAGPCFEACDVNDDDSYDQSDAIYVFMYRFLDGPPPAAPFPDCDEAGDVDCDDSSCP